MRFLAVVGLLALVSGMVPFEVHAQSRAECEDGIREIRQALADATTPSLRDELSKALRDAERELGEDEYDECMEAVEDARQALSGSPADARRPRVAPEHLQADDGLPVTIEDAFVPGRGEVEATLSAAYNRVRRTTLEAEDDDDDDDAEPGRSGRHLFETEAELEIGLGAGFAAVIGASYVLGDAEDVKNGEFELGGKWNFLPQQELLPALTLLASVSVPYGYRNDTVETSLGLLASKALGSGAEAPYLHANLFWIHAFNRDEDARANRFAAVLGYTHPLGPSTALVADLVHEKDEDKGRITNLVEVGLRQALPGDIILGVGLGAGFGGSATDFRALLGIQKEF